MIQTRNKNLRILIPNATGPSNPGDQAMLESLLKLIRKDFNNPKITIHSTDPEDYQLREVDVKHTLYSYCMFRNINSINKAFLSLILISQIILISLNIKNISLNRNLYNLLEDYIDSEIIFFVGGGYLRSKKGIKQMLNLFFTLIHFYVSFFSNCKKIVAPISIGPFGNKLQENIVFYILNKMDFVFVREKISLSLAKKHNMSHIQQISDHALLLDKIFSPKKNKNKILGFTMREWQKGKDEDLFENIVTNAIKKFALDNKFMIQPIIQVESEKYGESDTGITNRIIKKLKREKIKILYTKIVKNTSEGLRHLSSIDLLLGMRMHSNIFSAIQGTPFATISYEHKAEGISEYLNMRKYLISFKDVSETRLYNILNDLNNNKTHVRSNLEKTTNKIRLEDANKWSQTIKKLSKMQS